MQISNTNKLRLKKQIRSNGLRMTNLKSDVFALLNEKKHAISIQEIVKELPNYDQVSIYRTIDGLRKANIVKLVPHGFKNLYELSDVFKPHHHHISCDRCSNVVEIEDKVLENTLQKLASTNKYKLTGHHLELHGLCAACQNQGNHTKSKP